MESQALSEAQMLRDHYLAIGGLCATWAVIDRQIDTLIGELLPAPMDKVASITTNMDTISARCEVAKRLIVLEYPHPQFRDWVLGLLQRVSGEIAPLRNRYVHDAWQIKEGVLLRHDKRASVKKPQAHQEPVLVFDISHVTDPGEVGRLDECARFVMTGLALAIQDLERWRKRGVAGEPLPDWLPMSLPRARYLSIREHEAAIAQGQTPPAFIQD